MIPTRIDMNGQSNRDRSSKECQRKIVYYTNAVTLQLNIYACQLDGEIHVKNLLFNAFSIGYNSLHSRISCHLLTHRNYLKTTFLFSKKIK